MVSEAKEETVVTQTERTFLSAEFLGRANGSTKTTRPPPTQLQRSFFLSLSFSCPGAVSLLRLPRLSRSASIGPHRQEIANEV